MRVCLFDLNGTVLNDTPIWYETVKSVFKGFEKEPPTIREYFEELEAAKGDYLQIYKFRGIDIPRDQLNDIYGKIYERLVVEAELTPYAKHTLEALANAGVVLGLITTQPENLAAPILEKFGLTKLFRHLKYHCIDKKTAIGGILLQENTGRRECYYVGDSPSDVRHANNAGVVSVAFLDVHIPEELVLASQPRMTIKDFRELISLV
jgi:phosphoglycolate phosphatase-like HAD superfamily hydrolase